MFSERVIYLLRGGKWSILEGPLSNTGEQKRRGPNKDNRASATFKLETHAQEILQQIQRRTGSTPSETVGIMLHVLLFDPENAIDRLFATFGNWTATQAVDGLTLLQKSEDRRAG